MNDQDAIPVPAFPSDSDEATPGAPAVPNWDHRTIHKPDQATMDTVNASQETIQRRRTTRVADEEVGGRRVGRTNFDLRTHHIVEHPDHQQQVLQQQMQHPYHQQPPLLTPGQPHPFKPPTEQESKPLHPPATTTNQQLQQQQQQQQSQGKEKKKKKKERKDPQANADNREYYDEDDPNLRHGTTKAAEQKKKKKRQNQ